MGPDKAKADITAMRSSLQLQQVMTAAAIFALIVVLFMLKSANNAEKVVMQTPWGDKSRWISESDGPSRQLLIDSGLFMSMVTQNISPGSVQSNAELLKLWAKPSEWDSLKTRAEKSAVEARTTSAVSSFNPITFTPDVKNLRVAMTGEYRRWIGDVAIPVETRTFVFVFYQDGTRLYLSDWYESAGKGKQLFDRMPDQDAKAPGK